MSENKQKLINLLEGGCSHLGVDLVDNQVDKFIELTDLLIRWNKKINLTSITKPEEVITKHILDSLSLLPHVHGNKVLDVGTGAGFPGVPLALMLPEVEFTLLDSNNKKITFIKHVAAKLGLTNLSATHSRIQDLKATQPFTSITARAFADLNDLLKWLPNVYDANTQILAMKGKMPESEIESLREGVLSSQWSVQGIEPLLVPGLDAERCVVKLVYQN